MKQGRSIIYFNSGAIGEFLMTLHFAALVSASCLTQKVPYPLIIVPVRRNSEFLMELAASYPQVRVVSLERCLLGVLAQLFAYPRPLCVLTQQTFSMQPLRLKLFAKVIALLRGAPLKGYNDTARINRFLYNTRWDFDVHTLFSTEMERLAERLGFPTKAAVPHLVFPPQASPHEISYFVLHMTAYTSSRSWPEKRWHGFLLKLQARFPDTLFVCTGSRGDSARIERIIEGVPNTLNTAGALSVPELIGTIDHARVFLGVDTGITHLAAFRGKSMVVVGTNSTPSWWVTYNPEAQWLTESRNCTCIGNKKGGCVEHIDGIGYYRCLVDVTDEEVLEALARRLV